MALLKMASKVNSLIRDNNEEAIVERYEDGEDKDDAKK